MNASADEVVDDTRRWLERAVIGLNLCPFAKGVHVKDQVHYAVTEATGWNELLEVLEREIDDLLAHGIAQRETTLLMMPRAFPDFVEFAGFLGEADRLLQRRELEGTVQLANFHPHYQFAGTDADDITNFTNRAPYPTLHLLREDSIARAVEAFPEAEAIYETNMDTMRRLGPQGWARLMAKDAG
ncbi:DUF1415 domain-containing protein [Ramlibacter sp. MAHUQ-53]|uniref:DUF1415 domain-containing protein n=1 Tax=unclassified Ramlibacter TaxID=2617605 RepID=UPI003633D57A